MLGDEQREVRVLGLARRILEAVAVHGHDAVRVLIDDPPVRVHAEGADVVLELLRAVDDLALVQLVGKVGEQRRRKLYAHADVHAVRPGGDLQLPADLLHPLAAAAADGDDARAACEHVLLRVDPVTAGLRAILPALLPAGLDPAHRCAEIEVRLVLELRVQVLQDHIVDIRPEMAHGGVQKFQLVLHAELLELCVGGAVQFRPLSAVGEVDLIHIFHQLESLLLADVLVERAAEVIGDIVFSVREGAGAAESAHDRAGAAADALRDRLAVDGTASLRELIALLKHGDLQVRVPVHKFIGGEDPAGTRADDDHIISLTLHFLHSLYFLLSIYFLLAGRPGKSGSPRSAAPSSRQTLCCCR